MLRSRVNAEISETRLLRFGDKLGYWDLACSSWASYVQIPELLTVWYVDSWASFVRCLTPTSRPNLYGPQFVCCGPYSFDAKVQILTKMNCSHLYLSIVKKKKLPRQFLSKIKNFNWNVNTNFNWNVLVSSIPIGLFSSILLLSSIPIDR